MKDFLRKILAGREPGNRECSASKDYSNKGIIDTYRTMRDEWKLIPADEPNYTLAKKVFLDFNDFNLKNLDIHLMYLKFIPKSLLPYPKNYIKCAYYIFLDSLKKANDREMFEAVQRTGMSLFCDYPDYEKYKENLKHKSMYDDVVFRDMSPSPRELFKKLYGAYQISVEEYNNSPSSTDASWETLVHDFGVVPEIEGDVDFGIR